MAIEQPILWLGLQGFDAAERDRLEELLQQRSEGWPIWLPARFSEADAWMICGRRLSLDGRGGVTAFGASSEEEAVQLSLSEVDRPLAFSRPLADAEFEPMYTFKVKNEASVRSVLQQFEGWLRPLRAQFALAGAIMDRERELQPGVYHVSYRGVLLAMVDLQEWRVGLSPVARPVDFADATWERRPAAANDVPERFLQMGLTHLMWSYAQRSGRDILPAPYRQQPIYVLRPPLIPIRLLKQAQLTLLRELATAPAALTELARRTGMAPADLAREIASLYYAGALTVDKAAAAKAGTEALDSLGLTTAGMRQIKTPMGAGERR